MNDSQLGRFIDKILVGGGPDGRCWLWTGATTKGYGRMTVGPRGDGVVLAHRLAFEHFVGAIPDGLQLHHVCRVRACVNPSHLEPVTNAENTRRGLRGRHHENRDQACMRWLSLFLAAAASEDFTRPTRECRIEAAQSGYGWTTLQRAAARLKIEKFRRGGWGSSGAWYWRLPDAHPLRLPDPDEVGAEAPA